MERYTTLLNKPLFCFSNFLFIHIYFSFNELGIQDGTFDAFLWETFTTKPSFDNNEVKKVNIIQLLLSIYYSSSPTHLTLIDFLNIKLSFF